MKKMLIGSLIALLMLVTACAPLLTNANLSQTETSTQPATAAATQSSPAQQVQLDSSITLDSTVLSLVEQTFRQIYKDVNSAVVNIQATQIYGPSMATSEGSGFVWDAKGHIVTNNHVVDGATQITVVFADGTTLEASIVGTDPQSDLAVIQVDASKATLTPIKLGDSSSVQVGDLVIAIGNPYGLEGSMTQGIVSALSRSLTVDESNPFYSSSYTIPDIIQTDAAINPGNSGGVLLNVSGEVIGVTSAIESTTGSNVGIGYAIPANIVSKVVPVLISDGSYTHPSLGLTGETLTPSIASRVGMDTTLRGVLVLSVTQNGPADQAGIQGSTQRMTYPGQVMITGGDVITAVDGQAVNTYEDLISYIFNQTKVGQAVSLSVLRDGKRINVDITLGAS